MEKMSFKLTKQQSKKLNSFLETLKSQRPSGTFSDLEDLKREKVKERKKERKKNKNHQPA
jgi:hypothetical protein